MMCGTWTAEARWISEPDISAWIAESRLNLMRGLLDHLSEPAVRAALDRHSVGAPPDPPLDRAGTSIFRWRRRVSPKDGFGPHPQGGSGRVAFAFP